MKKKLKGILLLAVTLAMLSTSCAPPHHALLPPHH
jgi:hypothetical protein